MKILTIIKDDHITGIEYGMVEVKESDNHVYSAPTNQPATSKNQKIKFTKTHCIRSVLKNKTR